MLLDGKPRSFKTGSTPYDPNEEMDVDVGNVEVQIKHDPTDDKNYHFHLGGKRVFQWLKEKWQSLKQTVKRGFGIIRCKGSHRLITCGSLLSPYR